MLMATLQPLSTRNSSYTREDFISVEYSTLSSTDIINTVYWYIYNLMMTKGAYNMTGDMSRVKSRYA